MEIDAATEARIDTLAEQGNAALEERGDWRAAVATWRRALALLPAPAERFPQAVWLHASIGAALREGGREGEAFEAFDAAYRSEDGHVNPFVLLNLGGLMRPRDEKAAVELLLRAYMMEGAELFEGAEDDLKFLAARVDLGKR